MQSDRCFLAWQYQTARRCFPCTVIQARKRLRDFVALRFMMRLTRPKLSMKRSVDRARHGPSITAKRSKATDTEKRKSQSVLTSWNKSDRTHLSDPSFDVLTSERIDKIWFFYSLFANNNKNFRKLLISFIVNKISCSCDKIFFKSIYNLDCLIFSNKLLKNYWKKSLWKEKFVCA